VTESTRWPTFHDEALASRCVVQLASASAVDLCVIGMHQHFE